MKRRASRLSLRSNSPSYCSSTGSRVLHSKSYCQFKSALQKSIPAAILLWAFKRLPSRQGLTSRKIIGFVKKHYKVAGNPHRTGWAVGKMLRCAEEYGLIRKRGNRFFLEKSSLSDL